MSLSVKPEMKIFKVEFLMIEYYPSGPKFQSTKSMCL